MSLQSQSSNNENSNGTNASGKPVLNRLWNIITRDMPGLLGSGILATLSCFIYVIGLIISIDTHALLPLLIICPIGGMIAAPQLCGIADIILRTLRNDTDAWWKVYSHSWKRNFRCSLLPGLLGGLLFSLQLFVLIQANDFHLGGFLLLSMLIGVTLATAVATWLLPQLVLMDLPLHRALLNAILLCFRYPLKTLGSTLIQLAYWGILVLTFPFSLAIFVMLNFWLPMLASISIIYSTLDETFLIEEGIDALHKASEPDED